MPQQAPDDASPLQQPVGSGKEVDPFPGRTQSSYSRRSVTMSPEQRHSGVDSVESNCDPPASGFRDTVLALQQEFPTFEFEELEEIFSAFSENASGPNGRPDLARISGYAVAFTRSRCTRIV
eukprot:3490842-Rhodomonas_salina.1